MVDNKEQSEWLGTFLSRNGLKVATAESLTAGLVAGAIADIPGSSAWLDRGWIVYCNDAKEALGVPKDVLDEFGAVSHECAKEMAKACLSSSKADIAVSTTGLAGPGGDGKRNAGNFFIGIATREGVASFEYQEDGGRNEVRSKAVGRALQNIIFAAGQLAGAEKS